MFAVALIVFREVLEVALVVTVLLAATRGIRGRKRWIGSGITAGVLGSVLLAAGTEVISSAMDGAGQEFFNGIVLALAAVLIAWTVIWMRMYGATLGRQYKETAKAVAAAEKPLHTLAIVAGLASLREGSEMVLFTYGLLTAGSGWGSVLSGGALGLSAGILAGAGLYLGLVKASMKHLFTVTGWLLIFLACGMAAQSAKFFAAGGMLPEFGSPIWDTSRWLAESGAAGQILHGLLGYSDRPMGIQVCAYVVTLLTLGTIMFALDRRGSSKAVDRGTTPTPSSSPSTPTPAPLLVMLAVFLIGASLFSAEAFASNKVYSPHVDLGEWELETRGGVDFDHRASKDDARKQKYAIGYGVTDWWFTEIYGEIKKPARSATERDFEFTAVEFENRFELNEPGEAWVDAGLYFAYELSQEDGGVDKVEGKLLLEKEIGALTHRMNLILEKEVGPGASEKYEGGLAWSTHWRAHRALEPGVEWYSEFGELGEGSSWDEQKHFSGPVFRGNLGHGFSYEIGYLFGVSDGAADGRLKWVLEYEWFF